MKKSNVLVCDVESRHAVLGRVGAGRCHRPAGQRHQGDARNYGSPDNGIPEEVLEHAKCVAVMPHMVKGGFVFGGKGGKGVATCRTANGWSAPASSRFRAEAGGCRLGSKPWTW